MPKMKSRIASSAALVGIMLAAASPALPAQTDSRIIEIETPVSIAIETYELDNGLTVILSRDPSVPVVAVNLWYHVGSANEERGRTGFAHLFEHLMFNGSENVPGDEHFRMIEEAGGTLNGSTSNDRTNYYEALPSNYLELALWLESDRMQGLLEAITQTELDNQRSVVQNERRQSYENQPYGLAYETLAAAIYPDGHPYSWPVIGSMADLNAATLDDVSAFFRRYYAPNNASLAIVGDFDPAQTKRWIERYFGDIPSGPPIERPDPAPVRLDGEKRIVLEDRVQLPRLYINWVTPAFFAPGDAEMDVIADILAGGESSRLYRRLVFDEQLAQFVSAGQASRALNGEFQIMVQARPEVHLNQLLTIVDQELARLETDPPTDEEIQRALNNREASFIQGVQTVLGRAEQLNRYEIYTDDPGYLDDDYERYERVTRESVLEAIDRYLGSDRVILSIVPEGQTELQAMRNIANVEVGG